jgi:DNA-binding SARP family transcriptional activator
LAEWKFFLSEDIEVCSGQHRIPGLDSSKHGALLVYLALEAPRSHSRAALASFFWPDRSDQEALSSLRFALSNLRSALNDRQSSVPLVLADRHQVQINPLADVWVDVLDFRQQAAALEIQAKAGISLGLEVIRAAIGLYRGGFLRNLVVDDNLTFEKWIQTQREQLDHLRIRLLQLLAACCEQAGQFAQAEETYHTILAMEPLDEITQRLLIRLLDSSGNRSAALAQYDTFRQTLRDELGVEPQQETILLYQAIKTQAQLDSAGSQIRTPFVGRQREITGLFEALRRSLAGRSQVVLVNGEAGSGKTALLSEFARQALNWHPDLLVIGGRCNAYSGLGQPYLPFVESLQMLVGEWDFLPWANTLEQANEARLRNAIPRVLQTMFESVPDLMDWFIDRGALAQRLSRTPGIRPAWLIELRRKAKESPALPLDTGGLFEQITRLLNALARQHPLILLIDDFHWVDSGSAALLFHLVRRCANSRILIAVSYRSAEMHTQAGMGEQLPGHMVSELLSFPDCLSIDLDQTDEYAFALDFLKNDPFLYPHRLDDDFCKDLARHTGGNPLFIAELLRNMQVNRDLRRDSNGIWTSKPDLNWQRLPKRIEASIAGRIARLPQHWVDWLSTASVEGESFTAEVLARVHNLDEPALHRDLSGPLNVVRGSYRLLQFEGVQWHGGRRMSRYRFRHSLFQSFLYEQMDPAERSRRHAAVGSVLEDLYSDVEKPAQNASTLARHFQVAGLADKAATYWHKAGQHAMQMAAVQTAIINYKCGLELVASLVDAPGQNRLKLQLNMGLAAALMSTPDWGRETRGDALQRALEQLPKVHDDVQLDELFPLLYVHANWLLIHCEFTQAYHLTNEILTLAGERPGLPLALANWSAGAFHIFVADYPAARTFLERALVAHLEAGQPPTQALIGTDLDIMCRAWLGLALVLMGFPDQAWQYSLQALERARTQGKNLNLGAALAIASIVATLRGDQGTVKLFCDELTAMNKEIDMPMVQAYVFFVQGDLGIINSASDSSQAKAAVEAFQKGMDLLTSLGMQWMGQMWLSHLGEAMLKAGQIEAGLDLVTRDIERIESFTFSDTICAGLYRIRGQLLMADSPANREEAILWLRRSQKASQHAGTLLWELQAVLCLAQLLESESPAEAHKLLTGVYAQFQEGWDYPDLIAAREMMKN